MPSDRPIPRPKDVEAVEALLEVFPAAAILGARQVGKTTLAGMVGAEHVFDLENPRILARFDNPLTTLESLKGQIIIDEVQRVPELFAVLRHIVDTHPEQRYLLLGSASRDLIRQSSESLAGRIGYHQLGGLRLSDVGVQAVDALWLRGGLPRSFLAGSPAKSVLWRENYVTTFLERDIPQLGIQIPANTLRRFWVMLSHYHGQGLNFSELGRSFGISDTTVRRYLDILQGTFMVRLLEPWHYNTKKRLKKRPKLFIRDSGILHTLMTIETMDQLLVHNKLGASWEGFALEMVVRELGLRDQEVTYWATHTGAELDLRFQAGGKSWGVEFKYADAPRVTKSMRVALEELDLTHLWVVYPGADRYPLDDRITVMPIGEIETISKTLSKD